MTIEDDSNQGSQPPKHDSLEIDGTQSAENRPGVGAIDVAIIQESLNSGQHHGSVSIKVALECAKIVSGIAGAIVVGGAIVFVVHCAQAIANEEHRTVWVSYSLTFLFTVFSLLSLAMIFAIPFRMRRHRLVVQRYIQSGSETCGRFVTKEVKQVQRRRGPPKLQLGGIVAYRLDDFGPQYFGKHFKMVNVQEFRAGEVQLLVLPDVPTSAVLKRNIDKMAAGPDTSQLIIGAVLMAVAPIFWLLVFVVGESTLPAEDFWTGHHGLVAILFVSLVCGVCLAYWFVEESSQQMLYGGANQIPQGALPPNFHHQSAERETSNASLPDLV